MSITNEIMREPTDNKVNTSKSKIEIEMENICDEIEKIKEIKKKKLKDLKT
jgi:hypothetical protein